MKTIAVIQARLGSTRLPGKILLPLAGKSMLQNVVERVRRAKLVDEVWFTFPGDGAAPQILPVLDACDVMVHFSPSLLENDLIARLLLTVKASLADAVIRICADNPCVEWEQIDWLCAQIPALPEKCRLLKLNSESFIGNHDGFGGELYPLEMLEWMDRTIKDPEYREHPHKFFRDIFAWHYLGKDYPRGFRLDVNTEAEYQKLKAIYDHFGRNDFTVREVMDYLTTANLEERHIPT